MRHPIFPRCSTRMCSLVVRIFILNVPLFKIITVVALWYPLPWVGSLVIAAMIWTAEGTPILLLPMSPVSMAATMPSFSRLGLLLLLDLGCAMSSWSRMCVPDGLAGAYYDLLCLIAHLLKVCGIISVDLNCFSSWLHFFSSEVNITKSFQKLGPPRM